MAVASVRGSGMLLKFALVLHELVEWSRAFGLYHGQPRQLPNEVKLAQLAQGLSERGRIAEIATRQHDPVRWIPIALVQ